MSKFYYNGILLPDIPKEHVSTNPYMFIRDNNTSGYYELVMCTKELYFSSGVHYNDTNTAVQYKYRVLKSDYLDAIEWEFESEITNMYFGIDNNRTVLWSNTSILNGSVTSTTIYFPKCEVCQYGVEKLKYNDVLLPSIPPEHFETNPFVWIRKNDASGYYDLIMDTKQWYYENGSSSGVQPTASTTQYWYRIPVESASSYTEWEFNKEATGWYTIDDTRTVFWTLQDISNGQGSNTIYLSATSLINTDVVKYLIRSTGAIYTVQNDALVEVSGELNAQLFQDSGVDEIPSEKLLLSVDDPEVLCWTNADAVPVMHATINATPQKQNVVTNAIDLTDASILGIEDVIADCDDELIVAVSFDNKQSWKAWTGTEWATLSEDFSGMSKETIEAITLDQWNLLFQGSTSMYLRVSLVNTSQVIRTITIDFANS